MSYGPQTRDCSRDKEFEEFGGIRMKIAMELSDISTLRNIQHEIRTTLSVILGSVVLLNNGKLTPQQKECLEVIRAYSINLSFFTNNLALVDKAKNSKQRKRPAVLLVEDNNTLCAIHKSMLEELNCCVETASTGEQVLKSDFVAYDLILLDIGLPGISGLEVAAEIRRREKEQKFSRIVVLTAYSDNKTTEQCRAIGIEQVIIKPVNKKILEKVIFSSVYSIKDVNICFLEGSVSRVQDNGFKNNH